MKLVLLVATAALVSAVAAPTSAAPAGSHVRLTREVAPLVRRTCRQLARHTKLDVVCPRLRPKTRIVAIDGLYGFFAPTRAFKPSVPARFDAYYELSFNAGGPFGTVHWIVAEGSPAAVRFWVLSDRFHEVKGRPRRVGALWVGDRRAEIYRFPEYPAGGEFGSHLAALVRSGPFVFVASIHGYEDASASARMAVAMALSAA